MVSKPRQESYRCSQVVAREALTYCRRYDINPSSFDYEETDEMGTFKGSHQFINIIRAFCNGFNEGRSFERLPLIQK